jgi:predicted SnoaL-like aldol condensation-catalyzing enzyme
MKLRSFAALLAGLALMPYATSAPSEARSRTTAEKANMKRAEDFLLKVVEPINLGAFKDYVATDYIEHFPGLKGGLDGLVGYFRTIKQNSPGGLPLGKPVLSMADGDITLIVLPGKEVDGKQTLRLEIQRWKDGLQKEHWDTDSIGSPPAAPIVHSRTAGEQRDLDRTLKFWRDVFEPLQMEQFKDYIATDYIEHDTAIPEGGGLSALVDEMNRVRTQVPNGLPPAQFVFTLVDGDLVALVTEKPAPAEGQDASQTRKILGIELMRIKNGKMVEHWGDVVHKLAG